MTMKILKPTLKNIKKAAHYLNIGELVGIPTETVYGLAANTFNTEAVLKIFKTKNRPTFDPLIVHISTKILKCKNILLELENNNLICLDTFTQKAKTRAKKLMLKFWPGPLTLVLPKHNAVPDIVTSGLPTIAIRMPNHKVTQQLLSLIKFPLAAPSANLFGKISPTTALHVLSELGNNVAMILDGGTCPIGIESTVIFVHPGGQLTLLRPGGLKLSQIEKIANTRVHQKQRSLEHKNHPSSPGMLESHYAPKKPLYMLTKSILHLNKKDFKKLKILIKDSLQEILSTKTCKENNLPQIGLLVMRGDAKQKARKFATQLGFPVKVKLLSSKGNDQESAKNFFSSLRKLDVSPTFILFSEPCLNTKGLFHAIADRLKKASNKI
ncbi:MAG: threonylcarbamoyl-AMP synthase [Deltaproteobacteria bacterium]|nr:threonylcarbamoyl-AMP synthase [Deltaproteobacteria bacterium]